MLNACSNSCYYRATTCLPIPFCFTISPSVPPPDQSGLIAGLVVSLLLIAILVAAVVALVIFIIYRR